jgi:hypothetical protein
VKERREGSVQQLPREEEMREQLLASTCRGRKRKGCCVPRRGRKRNGAAGGMRIE